MPKSRPLAVRLPIETWDRLDAEASRKGMKLSTLVRCKLMISTEFEKSLQQCIDDLTKRLGISPHEFLEAVVVDFMARMYLLNGRSLPERHRSLPQFVHTDHGLLRGAELYAHLVEHYEGERSRDRGARCASMSPAGDDDPTAGAGGHDGGLRRFNPELSDHIMRYYRSRSAPDDTSAGQP